MVMVDVLCDVFQLLQKLWRFTEFHDEYRRHGWRQTDFASGVGYVRHSSVLSCYSSMWAPGL